MILCLSCRETGRPIMEIVRAEKQQPRFARYGFSRSQHREHGSDMADYQYFIVDRQDEVTVVQMRQSPGDDAVSVAAWRDELVDLLTTEDPE
ncbi:MAG: hypothetical protein KDA62_23035, partial [Planctomycetales bacterium]|nr:hypothetical protein [Planctomycetales bacterium]